MQCAKRINNKRKYPINEEGKIAPKHNEQSVSNLWEKKSVGSILRNRLPEVKKGARKTQDKIIRSS